ncbi:MAG: glycerate kinase [Tannerella sp.]|nr:glycerate kinase [Tannerella sp.]
MKKIVIAADSFKGSVRSIEVAEYVEQGIKSVFPECEVRKVYIADGGEGTVEALVSSLNGKYVEVNVHDPLMRPVVATYGILEEGTVAVLEMASASGLTLLKPEERNPLKTTTYGTGEMMADALQRGCRKLLVGIGGSATNDGGTGMLSALGFRFYSKEGNELKGGGEILSRIASIDNRYVMEELANAEITVACDVTNPFSGPDGAAYVYAPQKGADSCMVEELDRGLKHFADVIKTYNGIDVELIPGAGAAGGLGGGFAALLGARLVSGIEMVLETIRFREIIRSADLIITGEGKLDLQTAMGKAPRGVLDAAALQGIPVIAIGGSVENTGMLNEQGFAGVFSIQPGPVTLEKAMEHDYTCRQIVRTVSQLMLFVGKMKPLIK